MLYEYYWTANWTRGCSDRILFTSIIILLSFDLNILIVLSQYGWTAQHSQGYPLIHKFLTNCPSSKGVIIELINCILLFNQPIIFLLQGAVFIQGLQRGEKTTAAKERWQSEGVNRRKGILQLKYLLKMKRKSCCIQAQYLSSLMTRLTLNLGLRLNTICAAYWQLVSPVQRQHE